MLDKPRILSLFPNLFNKFNKTSCKILYVICRETIISGGISIPAAVSLSQFENKLYWADVTKMAIMSVSKFDPSGSDVVWRTGVKPTALKVVHQVLQPTDGRGKSLNLTLLHFKGIKPPIVPKLI